LKPPAPASRESSAFSYRSGMSYTPPTRARYSEDRGQPRQDRGAPAGCQPSGECRPEVQLATSIGASRSVNIDCTAVFDCKNVHGNGTGRYLAEKRRRRRADKPRLRSSIRHCPTGRYPNPAAMTRIWCAASNYSAYRPTSTKAGRISGCAILREAGRNRRRAGGRVVGGGDRTLAQAGAFVRAIMFTAGYGGSF